MESLIHVPHSLFVNMRTITEPWVDSMNQVRCCFACGKPLTECLSLRLLVRHPEGPAYKHCGVCNRCWFYNLGYTGATLQERAGTE